MCMYVRGAYLPRGGLSGTSVYSSPHLPCMQRQGRTDKARARALLLGWRSTSQDCLLSFHPRHESYVQLLTPVPALCPPSFSDSCLSMRLGQSSHARSGRAIDPSATLTSGDFLLSKISLDRNYGTITSGGKRGVVWGERSVSLSPFW